MSPWVPESLSPSVTKQVIELLTQLKIVMPGWLYQCHQNASPDMSTFFPFLRWNADIWNFWGHRQFCQRSNEGGDTKTNKQGGCMDNEVKQINRGRQRPWSQTNKQGEMHRQWCQTNKLGEGTDNEVKQGEMNRQSGKKRINRGRNRQVKQTNKLGHTDNEFKYDQFSPRP